MWTTRCNSSRGNTSALRLLAKQPYSSGNFVILGKQGIFKGLGSNNHQGLNCRDPHLESIPTKKIVPRSLVGMKEDTVSLKVVDSKKDDLKGVSCDGYNVFIVGTMAIDPKGINHDSQCVLTMGTMPIDIIICDPRILIVETMPIDTNAINSDIPRGTPEQCQARFMLENVVFGIFDDKGNIDVDINGCHHAQMIDLNLDNEIEYAFRQGKCIVPEAHGILRFQAFHSLHTEPYMHIKVDLITKPQSELLGPPCQDFG
eukprot:Gb_00158 [translate_table: standard]